LTFDHLTRDEKIELITLLEEQQRRHSVNKLATYIPYPKQSEFHGNSINFRERLLMAANQVGKTWCAGFEIAMHATGIYPEWWTGRRWDRPTVGWSASVTMEVSRDAAQRILLGRDTSRGTGAIPGDLIESIASYPNVPGAAALCRVRHVSGGLSTIVFKSYDQGRKKFQGDTIDWFWPDEEPPEDIYSEGLTRTNATGGMVLMTFTPLLGMSNVVHRFLNEQSDDRVVTRMGLKDAMHYTEVERERIINSYPEHERKARVEGLPMLGQGMVFPIAREAISIAAFPIPEHWPRIAALDFGWDHPTTCSWLAWDRDNDCVYVYDCYTKSKETPVIHAAAVKSRLGGDWIPVMWPHDGLQHDKGSGEQLATQYRKLGVKMHHEKVTFSDGTNGLEAGVMEMLTRMQTGRLKVFSHLEPWFEEFAMYHRKDGLIVKERDDILSSTRYAIMGLRFAQVAPSPVEELQSFPVDY
jgi:phage terminase large subunit-like protein